MSDMFTLHNKRTVYMPSVELFEMEAILHVIMLSSVYHWN